MLVAYLAASGVASLASGAFSLMGGSAQQLVEQAGQKAQEMAQKPQAVQQQAQEAKPQASRGAWITFGALVLSLGAALVGAMAGRRAPRAPSTWLGYVESGLAAAHQQGDHLALAAPGEELLEFLLAGEAPLVHADDDVAGLKGASGTGAARDLDHDQPVVDAERVALPRQLAHGHA